MKTPKDIHRYITPWLAAVRLIGLSVDRLATVRPGVRVRWELKVSYYYPPEVLKEITGPCVSTSASFSSGDEFTELTGNPSLTAPEPARNGGAAKK